MSSDLRGAAAGPAIGVLVVEDHPVMRMMIEDYLANESEMRVCGTAGSGEEALRRLATAEPQIEILVVDTSLPGMSGIELVRELAVRHPRLRCIMYSGYDEAGYVQSALTSGARGYVLKSGEPSELPEGIRRVARGELYLSGRLDHSLDGG